MLILIQDNEALAGTPIISVSSQEHDINHILEGNDFNNYFLFINTMH